MTPNDSCVVMQDVVDMGAGEALVGAGCNDHHIQAASSQNHRHAAGRRGATSGLRRIRRKPLLHRSQARRGGNPQGGRTAQQTN